MSIATIRQYHLHKLIFWAIHTFGSFELFERFGPFNFGNVEIANVGQRQKFEQIQRQCISIVGWANVEALKEEALLTGSYFEGGRKKNMGSPWDIVGIIFIIKA
ncbi:hypothetical protein T02_15525 [Trichinella nativa]|uniref:Uncharacterized protein n=1 Tax=Trichinella nativa TaxID=6335 RepID=A0A0V1L4I9_9BILA|nr:hypothetical protein T02_15525 [Trichinella nativa]